MGTRAGARSAFRSAQNATSPPERARGLEPVSGAQFPGLQSGNLKAPIRVSQPADELAWDAAV